MQVAPSLISPSEAFDVFYFIRNHTDGTTYYVRARIYDVRTGELLNTVDLAQAATNSRLFIKTLQAPADPVGLGRNIVAIASVYTDSAYTTKSDAYEEQEQYFLIRAVSPFALSGGGGGGVDYQLLREMLDEAVAKGLKALPTPKDIELPDQPDMSFVDALFGTLGKILQELNRVPKKTADLGAIIKKIEAGQVTLLSAIDALPQPDTAPMEKALEELSAAIKKLPDNKAFQTFSTGLQALVKTTLKEVEGNLEEALTEVIESQEITIPVSRSTRGSVGRKAEAAMPDLSHIM
jgi:hypothetical protein